MFLHGLSSLHDKTRRKNLARWGLDDLDKEIAFEAYAAVLDIYDNRQWVRRSVQKRAVRPFVVRKSVTTDKIGGLMEILREACADGVLELAEIVQIQDWMKNNQDLHNQWPVSEIQNRLTEVLADGVITEDEQVSLINVIEHVVQGKVAPAIPGQDLTTDKNNKGDLAGKSIVLTGDFVAGERSDLENLLMQKGMVIKTSVSKKVDILLVGGLRSEAYAHGSFGSKFKKAMELHGAGHHIQIIHEKDFPLR